MPHDHDIEPCSRVSRKQETCRRILIVDPDLRHRTILSALLELEGHRVTVCACESKALSLFSEGHIDFVICDHSRTGVDGLSLLEKINRMSGRVPVLLISSQRDWGPYMEAMNRGALGYLTKPLDYQEIQRLLELAA